jgi:hypothetical protein
MWDAVADLCCAFRLELYSRGTPSTTVGGSCRMVINITSEDHRYAKAVNLGLWIGAGAWKGRELVIEYVDLLLVMSCEAMADHLI